MTKISLTVDIDIDDAVDEDEQGFIEELESRGYYFFKPKTMDDRYKLDLFQQWYGKYTSAELENNFLLR